MMRQHQSHWARRAETATALETGSRGTAGATPTTLEPGEAAGTTNPPRPSLLGAIVQREVSKRRGTKTEQWYTDRDPGRSFRTKEEALAHQRRIDAEKAERDLEEKRKKRATLVAERKLEYADKFKELDAIKSSKVRLFKTQGKEHDDVPHTVLDASNAKTFMAAQIARRRTDQFSTQVIKLNGFNFVMDPGPDIGITPAVYEPKLFEKGGLPTMSRDGKAKTYGEIAIGLDAIAEQNAKEPDKPLKLIRSRMGKDIDRLTRGNQPNGQHNYSEDNREKMTELAAVLRLDKARVENATNHIRKTFISGEHSFRELLVNEKYDGAGEGGVARLRKVATEGGYESEGSDIEEAEKLRKKRKLQTYVQASANPIMSGPFGSDSSDSEPVDEELPRSLPKKSKTKFTKKKGF